jgi:hypothetical protein
LKVKELIEALAKFPPDADVLVDGYESEWEHPELPRLVNARDKTIRECAEDRWAGSVAEVIPGEKDLIDGRWQIPTGRPCVLIGWRMQL